MLGKRSTPELCPHPVSILTHVLFLDVFQEFLLSLYLGINFLGLKISRYSILARKITNYFPKHLYSIIFPLK